MEYAGKPIRQWLGGMWDMEDVWAAAYTDEGEFVEGFGVPPLELKVDRCGSIEDAAKRFRIEVRARLRQGYRGLPFDDQLIEVPSFGPCAQSITLHEVETGRDAGPSLSHENAAVGEAEAEGGSTVPSYVANESEVHRPDKRIDGRQLQDGPQIGIGQ
jgi:hypothetical protein